jgi:Protein of unknown function (DUF3592)
LRKSLPRTHAARPSWAAISTAPLGIVTLLCAVFVGVGVGALATDAVRLLTWRPVAATVLATDIRLEHDSRHPTYRPVVVYRYDVDGRDYQADRVTPVTYASSYGWAETVIRRYAPGQTVTAYVDPTNPGAAYLTHVFDMRLLSVIGIPFCLLAFVAGLTYGGRGPASIPQRAPVPIFGPATR